MLTLSSCVPFSGEYRQKCYFEKSQSGDMLSHVLLGSLFEHRRTQKQWTNLIKEYNVSIVCIHSIGWALWICSSSMLHDQCDLVGNKLTDLFPACQQLGNKYSIWEEGAQCGLRTPQFWSLCRVVYIQYFHVHLQDDVHVGNKLGILLSSQLHWVPYSEMPQDVYVDREV